jgi:hypothetical protein
VRGMDITGRNNVFQINTRGGFPRGNDIILDAKAQGNSLRLIQGKATFDVADYITDNASVPNNRVEWTGGMPAIQTVPVPAGHFVHQQRLYPASVRLQGEGVTGQKLVRGQDSVIYPVGAEVLLDPGDQLHVETTQQVEMQVVPRMGGGF